MNLANLQKQLLEQLSLSPYSHKKIVFGIGCENPRIVLVGEAPGGDEEREGKPFIGKAGKNLNEFLQLLNLTRDEIYITNAVKLRPTKLSPKTGKDINRTPNTAEINFFNPFLLSELKTLSPEFVVTLGNTALNAVDSAERNIGSCHGTIQVCRNFKLFPLYHPAAIIYNHSLKEIYYNDLQNFAKLLSAVE